MSEFGAEAVPKFSVGRTEITRGAHAQITSQEIALSLMRHAVGDWGDLEPEDAARNDVALATEGRLLSVFYTASHVRFYVITEADRSATTILLPHEY